MTAAKMALKCSQLISLEFFNASTTMTSYENTGGTEENSLMSRRAI